MSNTLTIRDENTLRQAIQEWMLEGLTERLTVRELIRSRVYQEVQEFNRKRPTHFRGLVQPTDTTREANGFKVRSGREVDWKDQYEKATEAFEQNRVLILVGDRQCDSLEDEVEVKTGTVVSFLRLTPLVGG